MRVYALETRQHGNLTLLETAEQIIDLNRLDSGVAVGIVGPKRNLPALPGTGRYTHVLEHQSEQPGGHLLPRGDHGIVLAQIIKSCAFAHLGDQPIGHASHGGDDDRDVVALLHLRLDSPATLRIRSRSATEVPPNFMTIRAMLVLDFELT